MSRGRYRIYGSCESSLLTGMLEAGPFPASDLVELYHKCWKIEAANDELRTHEPEREARASDRAVRIWSFRILRDCSSPTT